MSDPTSIPDAPHLRSALFVPGHRSDRLAKAAGAGADALIVDLEDSVAPSARGLARDHVRELVGRPWDGDGPRICVRVHPATHPEHDADLAAAAGPGLLAVVVAKVSDPADVRSVEQQLAGHGARIWPLIESARGVQRSAAIADSSERIAYLGGGTSNGGDLAAALGYAWTPEGEETLYLRSKILIDARAACVPFPMTGVVTDLDDADAVRTFAERSRRLGYDGLMVIHPSHVALANRVFGSTPAERDWARSTLVALDQGARTGDGAVRAGPHMVDAAMRVTAEQVLARRPSTEVS